MVVYREHAFLCFLEVRVMEQLLVYGQRVEELLEQMAKSSLWQVRLSIAKYKDTPFSILEKLSKDESDEVRMAVAEHPKATVILLEEMSFDPCWMVRWAVAYHMSTSRKVLERLAQDEKWRVRLTAEKCLEEAISHLEKKELVGVRLA